MKFNKLLVLLGLVTSIFTNHIATPVVAQTTSIRQVSNAHDYTVQWTNNDFGTYYEDIDFSSYSTIKSQLQELNSDKIKIKSTVGYSNMPTNFSQTDYDPNNKSKVIGFYTNRSATYKGNMNREHVWPNSRGGGSIENDIHVIRPTFTNDNSSRGNSFYVEGMKTSQNGWDPKTAGMLEESRGYAARIIFYACIANPSLQLVDKNTVGSSELGYRNSMGKLSDLLKWNLQYDVDITELNRNNGAEDLQGNRNPFIDNPYLACAIWGNYNDATRQICAEYNVIVDPYTGDITLPDTPSGGGDSGSGDSDNTESQSKNWGTLSAPITTDQARANMADFADKQTSSSSGYVKGTVTGITEISDEYKNVTLTLDNDFIVYRCKTPNNTYDSNNPEVKVGDEIVVTGTYQKWMDDYEIIEGQIISVNEGGAGSTTPEPETPSEPVYPEYPDEDFEIVQGTSSLEVDFKSSNLPEIAYDSNQTVTIQNKNYYFSDIYVGFHQEQNVVRLGTNAKTGSSSITDLGLSGTGSYLEPVEDLIDCVSFEIVIEATYSGTDGYVLLFRDSDTGDYETLTSGTITIGTPISYTLTQPRDGNFVFAITGTKARADLLTMEIGCSSTDTTISSPVKNYQLITNSFDYQGDACLKFSAQYPKYVLDQTDKFGILIFSKNQLGTNQIEDLYVGGNLDNFKSSIAKYSYLDLDFTNSKHVEGDNYYYGAIINNCANAKNFNFTAVGYFEYEGQLFFTKQISSSYNSAL